MIETLQGNVTHFTVNIAVFILPFVENLLRGSIATTDQDSRLSWSEHINRSAVKFVGEEDDDRDQGLDDEEVRGSPAHPVPFWFASSSVTTNSLLHYVNFFSQQEIIHVDIYEQKVRLRRIYKKRQWLIWIVSINDIISDQLGLQPIFGATDLLC